jgi:hypothetical protein
VRFQEIGEIFHLLKLEKTCTQKQFNVIFAYTC